MRSATHLATEVPSMPMTGRVPGIPQCERRPCVNPAGGFYFNDRYRAPGQSSQSGVYHRAARTGMPADQHTQRVGVIINLYGTSYFGHMLDGVSEYFEHRGFDTLVQASSETGEGELRAWHSLMRCGCDGLVIHSSFLDDEKLGQLLDRHPASVVMNRLVPGFESRCIYLDNVLAAEMAATHLAEAGHRDIAMITGPGHFQETRERSRGFSEALQRQEIALPLHRVAEGNFKESGGAKAMQQLLARDNRITAVFAQSDRMAIGALEQCRKSGIRVPRDLSIVGFDDLNGARYLSPRLTTIRQPLKDIGYAAAAMAHELIQAPSVETPRHRGCQRIAPLLKVRESVQSCHVGGGVEGRSAITTSELSPRELECLSWTARGKTSNEIGVELGVTDSTIGFHLKNAMKKLGVSNRTHAVALCLSRSLFSID